MEMASFMTNIKNRLWAWWCSHSDQASKRMFHFSPLFFTSKMLSFFFWLNDRLSSVEHVQIAVKKSGKESFLFSFYNCKKQTPRVWDMGETGV